MFAKRSISLMAAGRDDPADVGDDRARRNMGIIALCRDAGAEHGEQRKGRDAELRETSLCHSRESGNDKGGGRRGDQKSSGFASSFTCHGRPCLFSMSMKGSGSICSMLNTPPSPFGPVHVPVTIIAAPIIAGTPVV